MIGYAFYYRKSDQACVLMCSDGCKCVYETDFCYDCQPGYVWSSDHTCRPAVVGILGATLVAGVASIVFIIIVLVKVNGAVK